MLRPILLVGVGGSGGKTLRAMRQSLLRKLRQAGWDKPDLPQGWQMVWVDSVSTQDEDAFRAPLLPPVQYAGLVSSGLAYSDLRTTLERSMPAPQRQSALAGWVPPTVPIAIAAGAGQARAIGRVISAANLKALKAHLQRANDRMSGVTVSAELTDVSRRLGQSTDVALTEPMAVVISSLAGGSGSGMFLDVVEALKSVNTAFREPVNLMTVLYTPDVFASIGGAGGQIPPNALGAIVETAAGVFADGLSSSSDSLFQSNGLVGRSRHGFGAKCNFLVGAGNQNVILGSQEDVYYAVGESLCAVVTDDTVQQELRAFALTNIFLQSGQAMLVQDESRLTEASDTDQSMPFAALGMGRVSLGTDRLAEFISGLVGRDITERLLWPEFEKPDPQRPLTKEQLVDQTHAGVWTDFLKESGLNERNPADDVIKALTDTEQPQRLATWAQEGLSRARQGVDQGGLPPNEWATRLQNHFDNFLPMLRAQETAYRYVRAQGWSSQIQGTVVDLVASYAIKHGLRVTVALLNSLIDEMAFVIDELTVEATTKQGQVGLVPGRLTQVLSVGGSRIGHDDQSVLQGVKVIRIGADLATDADRHELAASLLKDLTENFLRPLLRACQFSRAQLNESVNADKLPDGRPNSWAIQPDYGRPVPTQLLPGATERVLIKPDSYASVLAEQIGLCVDDPMARQSWRNVIRERAALGRRLSTRASTDTAIDRKSLVSVVTGWVPRDTKASNSVAAATAAFKLPETFVEIRESVGRWLSDVELSSDLGSFLKQGLVDYVTSGNPDQQVRRQSDLVGAFTEAVAISAPFARVNPAVKAVMHPNVGPENTAVVSPIPFPPGEVMYDKLKNVLVNGGLWSDTQSPGWFHTAKVASIEVFTMSGKAMMPMVFDNLMKPISESWARNSGNESLRHSFWASRRARPLTEALPAGPTQVAAMVRGWFLAGLFDQRPVTQDPVLGWQVEVWDPETRRLEPFPCPLLSAAPVSKADLPAAVLKSIAIAMVKVNETGTLDPLRPYWRLMDLGRNYGTVIDAWIRDGRAPGGRSEAPNPSIAGSATDSLDSRRQAVLTTLKRTRASYESEFAKVEEDRDPYTAPRAWEIRSELGAALLDLTNATMGVTDDVGVL